MSRTPFLRGLLALLVGGAVLLTSLPLSGAQGAGSAPTISWTDQDLWIIHHYMKLHAFDLGACDVDGDLTTLAFSAPGYGRAAVTGMPEGTSCYTMPSKHVIDGSDTKAPSNFSVTLTAKDAAGNRVEEEGFLRFGALPLDTASIPGFIDIGQFPAPKSWPARFDMRVLPDGSVRAYKVTWDNVVWADTVTGTSPAPGETRVQIALVQTGTMPGGTTRSSMTYGATPIFDNAMLAHPGTGPWWNLENAGVKPFRQTSGELTQDVLDLLFGTYP